MAQTSLMLHEREEIAVALTLNPHEPWAVIGRLLNRHPTTISREVTANRGREHYRPASAQARAQENRHRIRSRQLSLPGPLRDRVIRELTLGGSPVAVWADLVANGAERVCVETIYAADFAGALGLKSTACLWSRRPRRRPRQQRGANKRTVTAPIAERPVEGNDHRDGPLGSRSHRR